MRSRGRSSQALSFKVQNSHLRTVVRGEANLTTRTCNSAEWDEVNLHPFRRADSLLRDFVGEVVLRDEPITERRIGLLAVYGDSHIDIPCPAGDVNVVAVSQVEIAGKCPDDEEIHP